MINSSMLSSLKSFFEENMQGRCYVLDGTNYVDAQRSQTRPRPDLLSNRVGNTYPLHCGMQQIPRIPNQDTPGDSELDNAEYLVKLPIGTLVEVQDIIKVVEGSIITYIDVVIVHRGRAGALTMEVHGQKRE